METEFLAWLAERLPSHPCLRIGPGDDAAVFRLAKSADCVVTTDLLTDGVDFELSKLADPRRIGHKALAVNLSDLAAMAAKPLAVVISLALPRANALPIAQSLYEGLLPLAARFQTAIAGGDTNTWDGPLAISVTAFGETTDRGPLLRSGAQPGDAILVTGQFGGSILGRHLDVEPRVAEALQLHANYTLHAGIDVSDGLSLDLSRMLTASNCGATLDATAIPIASAAHELARQKPASGTSLEHAFGDGEDFELILAVPSAEAERLLRDQPLAGVKLSQIGNFTTEPGLRMIDEQGRVTPLVAKGYLH
jgi:thiamine-monophosphate kinase